MPRLPVVEPKCVLQDAERELILAPVERAMRSARRKPSAIELDAVIRAVRLMIDEHQRNLQSGAGRAFPYEAVRTELLAVRDLVRALLELFDNPRFEGLSYETSALLGFLGEGESIREPNTPADWRAHQNVARAAGRWASESGAGLNRYLFPSTEAAVAELLHSIRTRVALALEDLESLKPGAGRPARLADRALAYRLRDVWGRQVGARASSTPGSPWLEFVENVFQVAGIAGSGLTFARRLASHALRDVGAGSRSLRAMGRRRARPRRSGTHTPHLHARDPRQGG